MLCKLSAEPTDVTLGEDPTFSTVVFFLKIFGSRFPLHLVSNATAVCLQGGGEETRSSSWSVGCEVLGKLLESRECLNSKVSTREAYIPIHKCLHSDTNPAPLHFILTPLACVPRKPNALRGAVPAHLGWESPSLRTTPGLRSRFSLSVGLFTSITTERTQLLAAARAEGLLVPSSSFSVLVGSRILNRLLGAVA